ncbi:hypothetical protein ACC691_38900, partial [Rhizobium johnstonii]|uniref:hypothetical protein n=1 Tax=Rhizobium johnstonii TaxID=3019933 RepID=UPI003F9C861B
MTASAEPNLEPQWDDVPFDDVPPDDWAPSDDDWAPADTEPPLDWAPADSFVAASSSPREHAAPTTPKAAPARF